MSSDKRTVPDAVRFLLAANDADVAKRTISLLVQVLSNVVKDPANPKARRFNVQSQSFQQQLQAVPGAVDLLEALNYRKDVAAPGKVFLVLDQEAAVPELLQSQIAVIQSTVDHYSSQPMEEEHEIDALDIANSTARANDLTNPDSVSVSPDVNMPQAPPAVAPVEVKADPPRSVFADEKHVDPTDQAMPPQSLLTLTEMGFSINRASQALAKADGNVERATHMLIGGGAPAASDVVVPNPQSNPADNAPADIDLLAVVAEMEKRELEERERKRLEADQASEEYLREMEMKAAAERDRLAAIALSDEDQVRRIVEQDVKEGAKLPIEVYNAVVLRDEQKLGAKYTCAICFDDFELSKVLVLGCHHLACINCMSQYISSQVADGKVAKIKCLDPKCTRAISFPEVEMVVPKNVFDKFQQFLLDGYLSKQTDARWCPKGCGAAMFGSADHPMMICPKCRFKFCFNCKTNEWHEGSSCEQYQQWKRENSQADKKFEEWAQSNTKPCPKCETIIEKNGGCDHMTCAHCHYEFWWSTGKNYHTGEFDDFRNGRRVNPPPPKPGRKKGNRR